MKYMIITSILTATFAMPAVAQDGDAAAGEKEFRKCKACHMIQDADGNDIVKGGKVGPNLFGVVDRKIAAQEGYKYGDGILAAAEANPDLTWTDEELITYMTDPGAWVKEKSGDDSARTKMTFKLKKGQADLVAYLASLSE